MGRVVRPAPNVHGQPCNRCCRRVKRYGADCSALLRSFWMGATTPLTSPKKHERRGSEGR
eukprot:12662934-Alexandrium_andersonii.AAC.1